MRLYNLQFEDGQLVGGGRWLPMTHQQAITARSKFTQPSRIALVEIEGPTPWDRYIKVSQMAFSKYAEPGRPATVVTHRGTQPTRYTQVCEFAFKYLLASKLSHHEQELAS